MSETAVLTKRDFFVARRLLRKTGEYAGHVVNDLPRHMSA
jgi:hypothetical protein